MDVWEKSCDCPDLCKKGRPCKHLLAVLKGEDGYGWRTYPVFGTRNTMTHRSRKEVKKNRAKISKLVDQIRELAILCQNPKILTSVAHKLDNCEYIL